MKVHVLDGDLQFPPVELAGEHGLPLLAGTCPLPGCWPLMYGAFRYMEGNAHLVVVASRACGVAAFNLNVSKSMRNELNRSRYTITFDQSFESVIRGCQAAPRDGEGTWISNEMVGHLRLHELGGAFSGSMVRQIVGRRTLRGLLGRMFFGESMFSSATNAQKLPSSIS